MNKSICCRHRVWPCAGRPGVAGTQDGTVRAQVATQPAAREFVIRDVRVFDGERVIPKASVHVRDGMIVSVGGTAPAGVESISGDGRTLLPGLIDAHTHAYRRCARTRARLRRDDRARHVHRSPVRRDDAHRAADAPTARVGVPTSSRPARSSRRQRATAPSTALQIPTLASAADAQAFVDARIAEGLRLHQDRLRRRRVLRNDRSRPSTAPCWRQRSPPPRRAASSPSSTSARARAPTTRLPPGASGLVHIFADAPADAAFVTAGDKPRARS